jgi:LacI family transcriptional regulator
MAQKKFPTLRSVAARLGVSVFTVSEALRDSPRVRPSTRERVKAEAALQGYVPNALLGGALSAVRRSRHQRFRGTLALIHADDRDPQHYVVFHRAITDGARARAHELGFATERLWLGESAPGLAAARLPGVLRARGISGAVLLPFHRPRDLSDLDLARLAVVQMDHSVLHPRLHTILPDHYVSMTRVLERLAARGYRRIGLCLESRKDERILRKWSAAFHAFMRRTRRPANTLTLIGPALERDAFRTWVRATRPDVILGHADEIPRWLGEMKRRVPEDVGFVNLNLTEAARPCAGLDLGPARLGAVAIETVVAMLHRRESGVPEQPQAIALEARWCEGPTLRPPAG